MTIFEKLSAIQSELSVPKNQRNDFGGFNYRSCEDILEKAKPLCKKYNTVLTLFDELVYIGDRYYVKATAHLYDMETTETLNAWAYAREEESKKGMDGSQVTGASSSYARKYALNGLFCIDDVKDSDYTNTGDKQPRKAPTSVPRPAQVNTPPKPQNAQGGTKCVECGADVNDKVKEYSLNKYGYVYCYECQRKYAGK